MAREGSRIPTSIARAIWSAVFVTLYVRSLLSMTKLVVDNRERGALLPLFRQLSDGFHVETLPVGDVLVEFPAGHGFLVERKAAADLAASICDGRRSSNINGSGG